MTATQRNLYNSDSTPLLDLDKVEFTIMANVVASKVKFIYNNELANGAGLLHTESNRGRHTWTKLGEIKTNNFLQ